MSYHRALGDWCSAQQARPECPTPPAGICIPTDAATLEHVKFAQRNVNRLSQLFREPLVDVDGRIGPDTKEAFSRELERAGQTELLPLVFCDNAMSNVLAIGNRLWGRAEDLSAPAVPDASRTPPSMPRPDGGVSHPPASQMKAGMSPAMLAVAGLAAYVGYRLFTKG